MKAVSTLATVFLCRLYCTTAQSGMTAPVPLLRAQQPDVTSDPLVFEFDRLIYDEQQRRLMLINAGQPPDKPELAQLWGWDGKRWTLIPGSGPSMRTNSAAVYDSRRKRLVMYGGSGMRPAGR